MTCKTGQMSTRQSGVNILKSLRLWDRWADVNETWHVYVFLGLGNKLLEADFFEFDPGIVCDDHDRVHQNLY